MTKTTALERAQAKASLEKVDPEQRAELLRAAAIGPASQARAIKDAFATLQSAMRAEDIVVSGRKGAVKTLRRPNWPARIAASRVLIEWLAPAVKRANVPGKTVVNVLTPDYARGMQRAQDVVIDVEHRALSDGEVERSDSE